MTAVERGQVDDQSKFANGIFNKLLLESPLLGPGGPGEALIHVEHGPQGADDGDDPPAGSPAELTGDSRP